MRTMLASWCTGGTLALLAAAPVAAAPVFTTGAVGGTAGQGITAVFGHKGSNQFTLASATHLTDFSFGLVMYGGTTPLSVTWSIGTSFFDTSLGSATTASFTLTPVSGGMFSTYEVAVDIPDIDLAAGTYYLSLQAATSSASYAYWNTLDYSTTPLAKMDAGGSVNDAARGVFTLNGTSLPEPGSFALAAVALVAAGLRRRTTGCAPATSPPGNA